MRRASNLNADGRADVMVPW